MIDNLAYLSMCTFSPEGPRTTYLFGDNRTVYIRGRGARRRAAPVPCGRRDSTAGTGRPPPTPVSAARPPRTPSDRSRTVIDATASGRT